MPTTPWEKIFILLEVEEQYRYAVVIFQKRRNEGDLPSLHILQSMPISYNNESAKYSFDTCKSDVHFDDVHNLFTHKKPFYFKLSSPFIRAKDSRGKSRNKIISQAEEHNETGDARKN